MCVMVKTCVMTSHAHHGAQRSAISDCLVISCHCVCSAMGPKYVFSCSQCFSCSATVLPSLHRLTVRYGIHFKICPLTDQALASINATGTISLPAKKARQLRPSNSRLLFIRRFETHIESRSVSVAVPTLFGTQFPIM